MATRLQQAKTGLRLRCVALGGKGIEAAVFENASQLLQQFVELLGLCGGSAALGQRQDPDSHDLAAAPEREHIAQLDRMARLFDPHPIETHPAGLGSGLRQRACAIEAGVKEPLVEPDFVHRVRNAARPAKGEFGLTGGSGRFSARAPRLLSLDRRQTGLAAATSTSRQPSAASTARASSLLLPRSETIRVSRVSASLPLASACSSSSSSRSSMSRRMARPAKTAKPAGCSAAVSVPLSMEKDVRPGAGGAGGDSFLCHTPHSKVSSAAASGRSSLGR